MTASTAASVLNSRRSWSTLHEHPPCAANNAERGPGAGALGPGQRCGLMQARYFGAHGPCVHGILCVVRLSGTSSRAMLSSGTAPSGRCARQYETGQPCVQRPQTRKHNERAVMNETGGRTPDPTAARPRAHLAKDAAALLADVAKVDRAAVRPRRGFLHAQASHMVRPLAFLWKGTWPWPA